jgi:hypothetical protein
MPPRARATPRGARADCIESETVAEVTRKGAPDGETGGSGTNCLLMMLVALALKLQLGQRVGEGCLDQDNFFG